MNDILSTYNGPAMLITSATRKWSVKSNHYHGNAIDIDWHNGGEEVLEYLINSDWAEANGLRFFVEDKRNDSSFLKESYKKHFRVIRHATGKHIHLEIN